MANTALVDIDWEIVTKENLDNIKQQLEGSDYVSIDCETTSLNSYDQTQKLLTVAVSTGKKTYCFPIKHEKSTFDVKEPVLVSFFQNLFQSKRIIAHNAKFDLHWLANHLGTSYPLAVRDTVVCHHLLDENHTHNLKTLSKELLGWNIAEASEGLNVKRLTDTVDLERLARYNCYDAKATYDLFNTCKTRLEQEGLLTLAKWQCEYTKSLYEVEQRGFCVDSGKRLLLLQSTAKVLWGLKRQLKRGLHIDFNLDSPKQLGELLYRTMRLPVVERTEKGFASTNEATLKTLLEEPRCTDKSREWIENFLKYRELQKLKSTYLEGLEVQSDGRIHCNYRQAGTVTGRLSCAEPNLQQIPREGNLKTIFIPSSSDRVLVQADYNQLELRIMAHYSRDPGLVAAFKRGTDIHRVVASRVFRKSEGDITESERNLTKQVNFGLIYGISSYGLARRMRISEAYAEQIINQWFKEFAWVRPWTEQVKKDVLKFGYLQTEFGRKRRFPNFRDDIKGTLRQAVNFPIQSLAADITNFNTLQLWRQLPKDCFIVATVHDSVVLDVPKDNVSTVATLLKEVFESPALPFTLRVPMKLEIKFGQSWGDLHVI